MELLKLVIVDDEPILLQGMLETYDWNSMGFEIVGTAQSGKQAVEVIESVNPDVVITDIYMKQMSGLEVMEIIHEKNPDCLFIVLSAYRDFEYAQKSCELGAYTYLLKPLEEEKLQEVMAEVYSICDEKYRRQMKYESWEKLLVKDTTSFLQVAVQKYVNGQIPTKRVEELFHTLEDILEDGEWFVTVFADIDLTYKITNSLEYEISRFAMLEFLEQCIRERFFCWSFESKENPHIFIIKTDEDDAAQELKKTLEYIKKEKESAVIAAISQPYQNIAGIRESYEEAKKLFELASISGASAFTVPEKINKEEKKSYSEEMEMMVVNAVRRNGQQELKEAFEAFIYQLPQDEQAQHRYLHRVMLKVEIMMEDSYGMTQELKAKFNNYYTHLESLKVVRTIDVCYKILESAIEARLKYSDHNETRYFKDYMAEAVAFIEENLNDEELSIVSVADHVFLNSVYFGRIFKKSFQMTFKQYLLQHRMEKAMRLLENGDDSIAFICEQVGIGAPSYFTHLFKQYTGKLPSEYKKEYEL